MIYSLSGKIIKKTLNAVVVSCGGVGYYVQCPTSVAGALPGVGREATLYTVMSVTENDISLYGFATEEQQSCFELLPPFPVWAPRWALPFSVSWSLTGWRWRSRQATTRPSRRHPA